jgi:hypothetical protein
VRALTVLAAAGALACGGAGRGPDSARRVASLPLTALLPRDCFAVLRLDLEQVAASTDVTDPDKKPFEVSEDLTEVLFGAVAREDGAHSVVLMRGDLDREALDREILSASAFVGMPPPRVQRRAGHDVVDVGDQILVDVGGGTWIWTDDEPLASQVQRIANGRAAPTRLRRDVRELADVARLEESVFALALVATDGVRDGIREIGDAFGSDAGARLAASLRGIATSVREDPAGDGFVWEVTVRASGAQGARDIAAIAASAHELAASLLAAIGLGLSRTETTFRLDGDRLVLRGHMAQWTNRLEWSRPAGSAAPRDPRPI